MKYFLAFLCLFLFACAEELPPGANGSTFNPGKSPITATQNGISTSGIVGGMYQLNTTSTIEFEEVQTFPFYSNNKDSFKSDIIHHIRFQKDDKIIIEINNKNSDLSFSRVYAPSDNAWKKEILITDKCKTYSRLTRTYMSANSGIDGGREEIILQLIDKNGIRSAKFNNTILSKSKVKKE